jgi:hypothetical protein
LQGDNGPKSRVADDTVMEFAEFLNRRGAIGRFTGDRMPPQSRADGPFECRE